MILITQLIFHINYYLLIDQFQSFVKFSNNSSAEIKLSKIQLSKIVQSKRYLDDLGLALAEAVLRAEVEAAKQSAAMVSTNAIKYFLNNNIF